jgi:hypothetical protein
LRSQGPNGIDYVEIADDSYKLFVYLFRGAPEGVNEKNIEISSETGRPIKAVELRLCEVTDQEREDCLQVEIDHPGNASIYTLRLVELDDEGQPTNRPLKGFDPQYAQAEFRFPGKLGNELYDCKRPCAPVEPPLPTAQINYLAKDYATFRRLILDRLALTMPGWQESHEADIGIVLIEVLAYVADYLSYYQDAVATEAYLSTARQRISVRRHTRLVDYIMHEGCNARAWVCLTTSQDIANPPLDPQSFSILAAYEGPKLPPAKAGQIVSQIGQGSITFLSFQPITDNPLSLYAAQNEIKFYTWGNRLCCLPPQSTRATLLDEKPPARGAPADHERILHLRIGDVLLFEEVIGPSTGSPDDADPQHRHFVRLTDVVPSFDPVYDVKIVEIQWATEDALPFSLCLSTIGPAPDCAFIPDVSVARGNVLMADHGSWVMNEPLGTVSLARQQALCEGIHQEAELQVLGDVFSPTLQKGPLTFRAPVSQNTPASITLAQDPRMVVAEIDLYSIPGLPDGSGPIFSLEELQNPRQLLTRLIDAADVDSQNLRAQVSGALLEQLVKFKKKGVDSVPPALLEALTTEMGRYVRTWTPKSDLLSSSDADQDYVVEMDDDGVAHLRFGDGECGRRPEAGESFWACYRVGNATTGNVGAETMSQLASRPLQGCGPKLAAPGAASPSSGLPNGVTVTPRNPLPAVGGTDPEPVDQVKFLAPGYYARGMYRAITADDYVQLAEANPRVQRAAAELQWTGIGYEAHVAIDPLGTETVDKSLLLEIDQYLRAFRRVGHDLVVKPPNYVSLDIAMRVNLHPNYFRANVQPVLLDVFSNRVLSGGKRGLFHPDNFSFGDTVYVSALTAAAQVVPGVESVVVTRLQRLYESPAGEVPQGFLAIGPLEVARLDNDPARPENGRFVLDLKGGR